MVEETGPGMKCLLMDRETTSIVSMAYSQSEMLAKEVYLFERMDRRTSTDPLKYLKCVVFVRPSEENIEMLQKELKNPLYGQYHLCKCNKYVIVMLVMVIDLFSFIRFVSFRFFSSSSFYFLNLNCRLFQHRF